MPEAAPPPVPARAADLSPQARIRNAALESFAAKGVAASSIRDVAAAAGVSPGLVQHHFGTKAGLRAAVDDYVIETAAETFEDVVGEGTAAEVWAQMGALTTGWVSGNALTLRYVARALAEGDEQALRIFGGLVSIARTRWLTPLAEGGTLEPGLDELWAAMHVILFNLAAVLLEPAISAQLGESFFSPAALGRWNAATTELYRRGFTA